MTGPVLEAQSKPVPCCEGLGRSNGLPVPGRIRIAAPQGLVGVHARQPSPKALHSISGVLDPVLAPPLQPVDE